MRRRFVIPMLGLLSFAPAILAAGQIYWTDELTDAIHRADLDGSDAVVVVDSVAAENPGALTFDPIDERLYWASFSFESFTPKIQRARLDGTGIETVVVVSSKARPGGVALDRIGAKLYFTDPSDCVPGCGEVHRVNLDGTDNELLLYDSLPTAIAVEHGSNAIWWANEWDLVIHRADLNGDGLELVATASAGGIAVDPQGGKLYWSDRDPARIRRANLDGTGVEDLVTTGLGSPNGVALDAGAGRIYWTDSGTGKIQRADLDGSGVEDVIVGLSFPLGLAIDPAVGDDEDEDDDDEDGDRGVERWIRRARPSAGAVRLSR